MYILKGNSGPTVACDLYNYPAKAVSMRAANKNSVLKDSYRATIGGRPNLPLFARGSVYFRTLIACDQVYFGAQVRSGFLWRGYPGDL